MQYPCSLQGLPIGWKLNENNNLNKNGYFTIFLILLCKYVKVWLFFFKLTMISVYILSVCKVTEQLIQVYIFSFEIHALFYFVFFQGFVQSLLIKFLQNFTRKLSVLVEVENVLKNGWKEYSTWQKCTVCTVNFICKKNYTVCDFVRGKYLSF